MGIIETNQKRIKKIKDILSKNSNISKSRLSHMTGLHYFVVDDVLENLKSKGEVVEKDKLWSLVK